MTRGVMSREIHDSIMKSPLYLSGEQFTAKDVASRYNIRTPEAQKVLLNLVNEGYLTAYESMGGRDVKRYVRRTRLSQHLGTRLSNYTPPIQPSELTASTKFIYGGQIHG